jgi:predicted DNA-binding WGR domain protein
VFNSGLEYELKFFGHYHDPDKNSDKIWGWVLIEGKMYNFWGRRDIQGVGKAIKFKRHEGMTGRYDLRELTGKKERKGYRSISLIRSPEGDYTAVDAVYPGFIDNMKKKLMFERLTGRVRGEMV